LPRRRRRFQNFFSFVAAFLMLLLSTPSLFSQTAKQQVIVGIEPTGNRRIPKDAILSRMFTHIGDVYDESSLERDFNSLWNTGYFDDLRFEKEEVENGVIIRVYVKEKPTIREIKYTGLSSVSQSDVIDRFKKDKVGLSVESQYDPTKVKKAEVVLKELLSEHGRQFATIRSEVRQIPPASVAVNFAVKEGPKVKVGKIKFENNHKVHSRELRAAMRNLRPIGIPHSIVFENLFSKTYDATKLQEDAERVRYAYQTKGYYKAVVEDPKTQIRDTGGGFRIWPFGGSGKRVDLMIPVEEGERYHLGSITFTGQKTISNVKALRAQFPIKDGDVFNVEMIRKGLENLRKAYGELGYINFTPVPDTKPDDAKKLINLNIDIDEGKQFYVRRIEFQGNTTTRDKVIRRELALEEGQVYNSRLWEFSLLRLNQLGYFNPLKAEEDSEVKQNAKDGTVDLLLKVKEKGKNSIGLTGGVSGLAGSFIGINYETNNFLGLGETLSVQASVGDRQRNLLFGFTEPYLFDRPLNFGFTVFNSKYDYNAAKNLEIVTGQRLNISQSVLNTLQNFNNDRTGFTVSASYPLKRSLKRVGLTYSFDVSTINTFSAASTQYFQDLNFRSVSGPDALKGIVTSKLIPSFTYNSINYRAYQQPSSGKSLFIGGEFAGIGGNVKTIRPIVEYKQFMPVRKGHVFGYRLQGSFLTGYGGVVAPPFERFYLGGDTDLRGFDLRTITPFVFIPTKVDVPLVNPDNSPVPRDPTNPRQGQVTVSVPVQSIIYAGGDTSLTSNVEYRIPIVGPVTLALFNDFGMNFISRESQLRLTESNVNDLNNTKFGCPTLNPDFTCAGNTHVNFSSTLKPISGTNYTPRMSTGVELQVLLPIINAPFRIYYAYNPLRLDTFVTGQSKITRDMFPAGGAGDYTYQQAVALFGADYVLKEPRKTFRFTVSTTF
jgi:outer membrane protein insertion porin family